MIKVDSVKQRNKDKRETTRAISVDKSCRFDTQDILQNESIELDWTFKCSLIQDIIMVW